ncbi:MAG: protease [Croceicoccus sp.]|nr:protease [Croceicoccus sp.]|tara:strand:+ start:14406 stop:14951 length:546 start_codon:yes stop_codon:yes gene_type:complete
MTQRVLIIATNGFEQSELTGPRDRLRKDGYEVIVASPESGKIKGWDQDDWGDEVDVDLTLDEVSTGDYHALVLPGGQINPDILRINDTAVGLIREFANAGKPVAAICHAPWLLIEADLVRGKTVTSWPSVRRDLANAGANVVDREVVVDGNIITSRNPDDIPAFASAVNEALQKAAEPADA